MQNAGLERPLMNHNYEVYYSDTDFGNGKKNQWIWFRAIKDPIVSGGGYLKLYFRLDMQTILVSKKEVMHKGQKIKLNTGEFKFICNIWFAEDKDEKWQESKFLKWIKKKFWHRLHKGPIKAAKAEVTKYSNEIYNQIQTYTGIIPESGPKDYLSTVKGKEN